MTDLQTLDQIDGLLAATCLFVHESEGDEYDDPDYFGPLRAIFRNVGLCRSIIDDERRKLANVAESRAAWDHLVGGGHK
ncbi:MAG: hypothetical protein WC277_04805 [Bacilli bacterium]